MICCVYASYKRYRFGRIMAEMLQAQKTVEMDESINIKMEVLTEEDVINLKEREEEGFYSCGGQAFIRLR